MESYLVVWEYLTFFRGLGLSSPFFFFSLSHVFLGWTNQPISVFLNWKNKSLFLGSGVSNESQPFMTNLVRHFSFSFVILLCVLTISYSIFAYFEADGVFHDLLSRSGILFVSQHLNSLLLKVGCPSALSFLLVFAIRGLITEVASDIVCPRMMMPSGSNSGEGASESSSKRPRFDLNLPPASEPEPASPSAPTEGVDPRPLPLSIAEQQILFRLVGREDAPDAKLLDEVRAIVRLKGEIVDRMFELDPESPEFWREHRDAIIRDSILTTHQREYPSRVLSNKLFDLSENSQTYQKLYKLKQRFHELGTFKH